MPALVRNIINVGNHPIAISFDKNNVWVTKTNDNTVSQISTRTGQIVNTIAVGNSPQGISSDGTYVWVTNTNDNTVSQISTITSQVVNTISVGHFPKGISSDGTYVWVANENGNIVSKISIVSGQVVGTIAVGNRIISISSDGTYVWVANAAFASNTYNRVYQISISTSQVINTIEISYYPQGITSDGINAWVTSQDGIVSQISIDGILINRIIVGNVPTGISSDGTYVWVANSGDNTVSQISIETKRVLNTINVGNYPTGILSDGTSIWVANANDNTVFQIVYTPPIACFLYNTKILTDKGYRPIQDLRNGDLIQTLNHDYKPLHMIGKRDFNHIACEERIKEQLYKCSKNEYPELDEDLIITGCHSILIDSFKTEELIKKTIEFNGNRLLKTGDKLRLPACLDERASVYEIPGDYTIYHLALENENYYANYGIYANGLLVETCSKRYLKELSNMELIE